MKSIDADLIYSYSYNMMKFHSAKPISRGVGTAVLLLFMAGCASVPRQAPINDTAAASLPTQRIETKTKTNLPADDTKKVLISFPTTTESTTPSSQISTTPGVSEKRNYSNLWDRIRAGFKLPSMEGPY